MNALLTRLGISHEIQAFFNIQEDLLFNYGNDHEQYGDGFHRVPTTRNLWVAGNETAGSVIITRSAMESIAFITIHRQRYPKLDQLAFIATGNRLYAEQINWICENFPKRRFTLVFGTDLLGRLTDIKLAAGLQNRSIQIFYVHRQVMIKYGSEIRVFREQPLSLHKFQEAFGIRPRIITRKPKQFLTFLDQLNINQNNNVL